MAEPSQNDIHSIIDTIELSKDASINILDEIDAFVFILDVEIVKPVWINKYFEERFHFTKDELSSVKTEEFLSLFHPKSLRQFTQRLRFYDDWDSNSSKTVYQVKSKYGEWIYMLTSSRVYQRNSEGGIKYLMGYATEVSKAELNDQIHQLQKLDPKPFNNTLIECLSRRELDVIRFIGKGLTDKEIAGKLRISFHTAKTHRKRILGKLKLKNSAALVRFAVENGIH